jgi:hypothetical protein
MIKLNSSENKFLNKFKELNTMLNDKINKIREIEIIIAKLYDNEILNEMNELNDFQKIKQQILNHRSKEELQKIENGKPKYVSLQEHIDAEKIYKIRLDRHVNDILIPGIRNQIQLLQEIQTGIETNKNNLIKSKKEITNKLNYLTPSESSKISKENGKKFKNIYSTNIDYLFKETLDYLTKVINYAESINKFYTSGNYKLFLSPTQIELQRQKTEKFINQFNTSNLNIDNKQIELLDVDYVNNMKETDKMKFLLNYNTTSFGTFKMKREGEDSYKYLYDLNKNVLVNSIYIANLINLNPDFKFEYVKDKSLIKDVSKVDSNNLVMFLPEMNKDQLKNKKMYNNKFYTINTIDDYHLDNHLDNQLDNKVCENIKNEIKDLLQTYQTYIEKMNYGLEEVFINDKERFGERYEVKSEINSDITNDINNDNKKNKYINELKDVLYSREQLIKKYINSNNKKVVNTFELNKFYSENDAKIIKEGKCPNISSNESIPKKDGCDIFDKNPNNYPLLKDFLIDKELKPFEQNEDTLRKKNPIRKDRQYVLGDFIDIENFSSCSYYFNCEPWIIKEPQEIPSNLIYNKELLWNFKYNMAVLYCIKNSSLLFPVRFILPESLLRYTHYNDKKNNKLFIGNLIIPFNDNRKNIDKKIIKHKSELFILNVFYNKTDNILNIFDTNSLLIYKGKIFNGIKINYLELYYLIKIWKMYPYLYIPDNKDTKIIENLKNNKIYDFSKKHLFLSTKNPQELINILIKKKYEDNILKKIITVEINFPKRGGNIKINKLNGKSLYHTKILKKGGDISNLINFGNKINLILNNIKYEYYLSFKKNVNYKFNKIYDIQKYLNVINYYKFIAITYDIDIIKTNFNLDLYKYLNIQEYSAASSEFNERYKNKIFYNKYKLNTLDLSNASNASNKLKYYNNIKKMLDELNSNLLYQYFIDDSTVYSLEILILNKLILKNIKMISFSKKLHHLEAFFYEYTKTYSNLKNTNIDAYELNIYYSKNEYMELVNKVKEKLKKMYDFDTKSIDKVLSYNYIQENFKDKYNFFYADLPIYPVDLNTVLREQMNQSLLLSLVLIMINTLEKGGNALFSLPNCHTKLTVDVIFILSQLFETVYLYNSEIEKYFYYLNKYNPLICKNYKGYNKDIAEMISNVVKELDKRDPSGGLNFNVLDEDERKELGITKEITKDTPTEYLKSFLKFNKKEIQPFYDQFYQYNTDRLDNLYKLLENIEKYARNIKDHPEIDKELKEYQLFNSITYANRLGLRIKKDINVDTFSNFFGKELLQDMFILDEGIRFKFNKDKNLIAVVKKCTTPLSDFFEKIKIDMNQSNTVIDTRDPAKYEQVKKMTKLYQTSLGYYLKSIGISYNNINVNRGWTKMYEMLHTFPELVGNKIAVKSFHLCDAPGGFILATEFFLKKRNATLNWKAQSLNPNELINIKKYGKILNDDFGILKQFPERWIWGKDNTGDISNPENIKFYSEHCKDVDLMTSDCGIDFGARDEFLEKINYSQFLFMFNNLPKGGNCLLKVFSPISSQKISILYLAYSRFKKMFFYKPMQNPSSEEFYMIGINYENPLNKEELNIMFNVLNNYNSEECLVDNIPEYFILQLENIMRKLADNYDRAIEKKIYYLDNLDKITQEHIRDLNKTIIRKNQEFADEMGLSK